MLQIMSKVTEQKYYLTIDAPATNVWDCVTKPELLKQWLMGFEYEVENWDVGSTYKATGVFEGKELTEKGTVLQMVPESLLEFNFLNSWEG